MMDRTTGYMGQVLNDVELTSIVQAVLLATYGDIDVSQVMPMPLLMVELADKDGWGDPKVAFINTEGVGAISDDYNLVDVYYYSNAYGNMCVIQVGRKRLASIATEGEQDLAEWVRTFGARLDSNVSNWQHKMKYLHNQLA